MKRERKTLNVLGAAIVILGWFGGNPLFASQEKAGPRYEIYTTNETENDQPAQSRMISFDCSDRVYIVVEGNNLPQRPHRLNVKWNNPENALQELTQYQFHGYDYVRVWAWIQLSVSTMEALGQVFDPSLGMDEFIGEWTVEVLVDNQEVGETTFEVLC